VTFVANLVLNGGFANVDESSLRNAVTTNVPQGADVEVSFAYTVSTTYNFAATITEASATKGIAAACSVNESQVSVTIGSSRRLLVEAASPRRLATSVEAAITSTTPDAAAKVHTAAGNASGLASAMTNVTGQNIAEPTVTPPKASVAVTTSVTAPADGNVTALSDIAQSSGLTNSLATSANATVTIADVQVITAAPTAAPAVDTTTATTTAPATTAATTTTAPATSAASTAATTTAAASNATTPAASKTTAQQVPTEQESFATMGGLSSAVLVAIMVKLFGVVAPF
jgi:hypothetical protein